MNKTYTRYAARTGRIIDTISIPDRDDDYDLHATLLYDGEADMATRYFVAGVPIDRPVMHITTDRTEIIADGADSATMTDIPEDARTLIDGPVTAGPFPVKGGILAFSADLPGHYTIRFELFPYLPFEVAIHAV
jgi:hypothetical protein